jgi:hypothetical protein
LRGKVDGWEPSEVKRATLEERLAEAEQFIAEGKIHVKAQRAMVKKLATDGCDTEQARHILKTLQDTLALFIEDRDRLKSELSGGKLRSPVAGAQERGRRQVGR